MARFNPSSSLLAGMPRNQLQVSLQNAQQAYLQLSSGGKVESASYTQGDGAKSVTYRQSNIAELANVIQMLQQQLGLVARPRRPITFRFQ
ncbi:gpW family head-tail joining protein [Pseudomonas sp. CCC3.2]|uniref:gpW family head-tail joining protein n=1 Tax=unclassified Pseudomonas TaxID=196821 RepID=UPI002AB5A2F6|nr:MULTISPECIES: gpW family head-tail joining protein [unclassified Pseudomonas]MDY7560208.1 gpW family head-tail joining protein [Pseudomonas sp. AB6]MEB0178757.1 gpW family head-tail joining protein [Pseudomonas sp. CCC3.2]MEB0211395.1 gpW family head-tail joining protein [Pseudomonas sp. AB6]